jgi:large subunit ribosomal protein L5
LAIRLRDEAMAEKYEPRLKKKYKEEVISALMKEFGYKNVMQVPTVRKVVLNMGLGEAIANPKVIEDATDQIAQIAGQRPIVTQAKKSISAFKLRAKAKIGAKVTLRGARMWEFLDRLITLAIPRIRDFSGVSTKAFDGRGSFTMGIKEQIIFPEINYDKIDRIRGMNISIITSAKTDEEAKMLLQFIGMPFRRS